MKKIQRITGVLSSQEILELINKNIITSENADEVFKKLEEKNQLLKERKELKSWEERLNKENQLKLVPKKEEEIKLEENDDELKIKCEPDIGGDSKRYYKCS